MKPAGIILRFIFCHRWQAGTASGIRARPHKDFAGFQVEAQGKSRTFFGSEDSRRSYKQLTPLSLQIHPSALARKSGRRGAACARIASDFLDFLVLFCQGKSTIKIQGNKRLEFVYGPDQSRKIMKYYEKEGGNFVLKKTKYYILGKTEKEVDNVTGEIRTLNYISGKAILEQTSSGNNLYYLHKDYQGTTLAVTDASGSVVQRYAYDPWGRRRDPGSWLNYTASEIEQQNFLFARGYTGHEHLDGFGLINMNGRMYDPLLGRMLSPDNYVQAPDNSQNFNRYSYAMNNPLVYTDPSGEFIIPAIMLAAYLNASIQLISGNVNSMGDFALSIGIGAASGAAGAGLGYLATSITSVSGFTGGAIAGGMGGFGGGFVSGAGNAWAQGSSFFDGYLSGLKSGAIGALSGAAIGGAISGFSAKAKGYDFWDGHKVSASPGLPITQSGTETGINNSIDLTQHTFINYSGSEDYVQMSILGDEWCGQFPDDTYHFVNGNIFSKIDDAPIGGITLSYHNKAKSLIWISKGYTAYTGDLVPVLGHEVIHAYHNFIGFYSIYGVDASEFLAYRYSSMILPNTQVNNSVYLMNDYLRSLNQIPPYPWSNFYPPWVPSRISH
jgi:RHS repeat-associated protein